MQNPNAAFQQQASRTPWNKGKLLGAKPPLRTKHVWSIRTKLQVERRTRDLDLLQRRLLDEDERPDGDDHAAMSNRPAMKDVWACMSGPPML
jgi:hypothetical protein